MPERLTVVKRAGYYLVAFDEAGEDWVARFESDGIFPAEDWAKRMVFLYNTQQEAPVDANMEDAPGLDSRPG